MRRWDTTPHATISEPFEQRNARTHRVRRGHRINCTSLITPGAIIAVLSDGSYVNDPEQNHPDAVRWFVKCENGDGNPWATA